jgi:DNA-binding response OmpR family regulator
MDISAPQSSATKAPRAADPTSQAARFGKWTARFDLFELQPVDGGAATPLTASEAALLRVFLTTPNQLFSREDLLSDPSLSGDGTRALDLRVSRLRQKLGDRSKAQGLIRTIYGAGYLFVAEVKWL